MFTNEEAFYHKLLLEAGVTGELEPVIDRLLSKEESLSDVTLRLAYCHGDPNEQLSALNEYLVGVSFESMDTSAVFEKLREYFRKAYEADPDNLKRLSELMYRISLSTEHEHDEPWQQLWAIGDSYDLVEDGILSAAEYRDRLVAVLYRNGVPSFTDGFEDWDQPTILGWCNKENIGALKKKCSREITDEECCLAHRFSRSNEADIHYSRKCGCFFCLRVFDSGEVHDWLNDSDGKTALCPYCGVDSVLPDSKVDLTKEFLEKMNKVWFGGITE